MSEDDVEDSQTADAPSQGEYAQPPPSPPMPAAKEGVSERWEQQQGALAPAAAEMGVEVTTGDMEKEVTETGERKTEGEASLNRTLDAVPVEDNCGEQRDEDEERAEEPISVEAEEGRESREQQ
eukprot:8630021-Ditylum_brightwellii.AAC.1